MKSFIVLIFLFVCVFIFAQQNKQDFFVENANNYILSKYQQYDIVILGETHWMKNELSFLKKMIPILYKNGVKYFAFEFLAFTAQDKIDHLINSENFSKSLRDSIIAEKSHWFVKEYMDILKILWKLNKSGNEKIKVIGLDIPNSFSQSTDRDSVMADVFIKYYSQTKGKALIYCGGNHAFTKFHQCKTPEINMMRMGNIIYQKFPNEVTDIVFFPLFYYDKNNEYLYYRFSYNDKHKKIFGMDLRYSPIAENTEGPYYLQKCDNYSLGNFHDGGIFINKKSKFCKIHNKNDANLKIELKKIKNAVKNAVLINK